MIITKPVLTKTCAIYHHMTPAHAIPLPQRIRIYHQRLFDSRERGGKGACYDFRTHIFLCRHRDISMVNVEIVAHRLPNVEGRFCGGSMKRRTALEK